MIHGDIFILVQEWFATVDSVFLLLLFVWSCFSPLYTPFCLVFSLLFLIEMIYSLSFFCSSIFFCGEGGVVRKHTTCTYCTLEMGGEEVMQPSIWMSRKSWWKDGCNGGGLAGTCVSTIYCIVCTRK